MSGVIREKLQASLRQTAANDDPIPDPANHPIVISSFDMGTANFCYFIGTPLPDEIGRTDEDEFVMILSFVRWIKTSLSGETVPDYCQSIMHKLDGESLITHNRVKKVYIEQQVAPDNWIMFAIAAGVNMYFYVRKSLQVSPNPEAVYTVNAHLKFSYFLLKTPDGKVNKPHRKKLAILIVQYLLDKWVRSGKMHKKWKILYDQNPKKDDYADVFLQCYAEECKASGVTRPSWKALEDLWGWLIKDRTFCSSGPWPLALTADGDKRYKSYIKREEKIKKDAKEEEEKKRNKEGKGEEKEKKRKREKHEPERRDDIVEPSSSSEDVKKKRREEKKLHHQHKHKKLELYEMDDIIKDDSPPPPPPPSSKKPDNSAPKFSTFNKDDVDLLRSNLHKAGVELKTKKADEKEKKKRREEEGDAPVNNQNHRQQQHHHHHFREDKYAKYDDAKDEADTDYKYVDEDEREQQEREQEREEEYEEKLMEEDEEDILEKVRRQSILENLEKKDVLNDDDMKLLEELSGKQQQTTKTKVSRKPSPVVHQQYLYQKEEEAQRRREIQRENDYRIFAKKPIIELSEDEEEEEKVRVNDASTNTNALLPLEGITDQDNMFLKLIEESHKR